jgi:hypothetical protein
MHRITIFSLFLISLLAFGEAGVEPPNDWCIGTGYQYHMFYYAQVIRKDNSYIDNEESILAAFDADGVCRGYIGPQDVQGGQVYKLEIGSNSIKESGLVLKVLDAVSGETYLIAETVDFVSDTQIPEDGITNPLVLHVAGADVSLVLEPGWNLVSLKRAVTEDSLRKVLALAPLRVEDNAYVRCIDAEEIIVGAGYWVFSEMAKRVELIPDMQAPGGGAELSPGWNLVDGDFGGQVKCRFCWDGKMYRLTEKPAPGMWTYRE